MLRNEVFRTLVETAGFTAVAMETGYAESRAIDAFVRGGAGSPADLALKHLTSGFGNFQANVELIEWMRTTNQRRGPNEQLRFFGIDLSLGGPTGSSATGAPIECALARVEQTAPAEGRRLQQVFKARVAPLLWTERPLTPADFALYDDFAHLLRAAAQHSGDPESVHCAVIAEQAGEVQRVSPPARGGGGIPPEAWRTIEARDMAMADNVLWSVDQLGGSSKLLIFAHNAHVMNAPQRGGHLSGLAQAPRTMGQRLRERLREQLVIVAEAGAPGPERQSSNEFGDLLRTAAATPFVLDLRALPPDIRSWLHQPRPLRANRDSETVIDVGEAFDAVVVQGRQSPARPNQVAR